MRSGRRVCATVFTAAAFVFCRVFGVTGCAWAGDDDDAHAMLLSGRDLWRHGAFSYGGVVFAPGGLEQDGLLLKILITDGVYLDGAAKLTRARITGVEATTQVLPGWRIKRGDAEFKFFMGPESRQLWSDDLANRLRGYSFGLRLAAELWYEPTPESMVSADVSLSSIVSIHSARIGYGWRIFEDMLGGLYVGPEVQYFGSDHYRHLRFGMHITSLKTDDVEWSSALGFARDSQGRTGPYVRLNFLKRL
jgi:hypothetical protein